MAGSFDPTNPLPSFNTLLPKVNTAGFLPNFGSLGSSFTLPQIHMPDFSLGQSGFMSGFKAFGSFLGGSGSSFTMPSFGSGLSSGPSAGGTSTGSWTDLLPKGSPDPGWTAPGSTGTGSGGVGASSGGAAVLNQYDAAFKAAGQKYGFDPNYLKAIATEEEGWTGTSGAGAIGIMQIMPGGYSEGEALYPDWQSNPTSNIMLGAFILSQKVKDTGSLDAGTQAYLGAGTDPYTGVTTQEYLDNVKKYYGQLQSTTTSTGGGTPGASNNVINIAESFVGKVPYVWGGIPGKGATPTGWDCSGFTYWLDQNYGTGTLPRGSHYQYQWAADSGQLFTSMGSLQPGDLMFFDTGDTAGAGSDQNRAGHVAMYIGNGQIVQAGNPETGTNISTLSDYYTSRFIGAVHMSWSG